MTDRVIDDPYDERSDREHYEEDEMWWAWEMLDQKEGGDLPNEL